MASTLGDEAKSPRDIAWANRDLSYREQEGFYLWLLNTKLKKITRRKQIFQGTVHATICHPRDIFREAIRANAFALIVLHNHPSGDPSPSEEDRQIAKVLIQIGELHQIPVLDFIIIGKEGFWSLGEEQAEEKKEKHEDT